MLFDWLVIGHIIDVNPAHAVRDPKYVVRKGKTLMLMTEEARELLDSIPLIRNTGRRGRQPESPEPALVGLRDRALIAVMVYSFARINAVLEIKVRNCFVQSRRGWIRLHEKGGKEHEVPCITISKSTSTNTSPLPQGCCSSSRNHISSHACRPGIRIASPVTGLVMLFQYDPTAGSPGLVNDNVLCNG
jgi:site-specific recombinase XerC